MKHHIRTMTVPLVIGALCFVAVVARAAYTPALTGPKTNNSMAPIDISATDQVKEGGLSVTTFTARGNAVLAQQAIFKGTVRGGLPTNEKSTVTVSGDVDATGSVRAKQYLNATSISHPGNQKEKPLCASSTGDIIFCE